MQGLFIASSGLGFVYIFGRILGIEKTDRAKNITALIIMMITTMLVIALKYGIDYKNWEVQRILWIILEFIGFLSFGAIVYVLIGWKLYSRMDSYLDKKFGEDKEEKKSAVRKQRTTKKTTRRKK